MKQLKFFLAVFFTCISSVSYAHSHQSLFVLLLMVKNEESVMVPTLEPFFKAGVQNYLILDTGSTDRTVEVTRQAFVDHNIAHGYVIEQPFVDFATSRNYAIDQAEQLFPNAVFFLMIDAEWYMHNVDGLLQFCGQHEFDSEVVYLLLLKNHGFKNYTNRLFKAHKGLRFAGVVHECLHASSNAYIPEDIYVYWGPARLGVEKTHARWHRDLQMLLAEHHKHPHDPRTAFYLAQTYDCLGDYQNALTYYVKRLDMTWGWDQENFITCYRIGETYKNLGNWPQALYFYLKAYSMRPKRVEPLVRIAEHYMEVQDFNSSFIFAYQAARIPQLQNESLFIDAWMYDYTRYDILGIVSWYVGEYEIGEFAVRKAMERNPQASHLLFNLSLYEGRKLKTV